MIGLLIISHSAEIARGVKSLAEQMTRGQVRIAAAGGTLDGELGTSIDRITVALGEMTNVSEVLALVDMGSAVMSAEMALELSGLPHRISAAPLVEGALVAAVELMRPDASLEAVAAAAEKALDAKGIAPIATTAPPDPAPVSAAPAPQEPGITLELTNKDGLHMRPAKEFVATAGRFSATIRVRNLDRSGQPEANAKSLIDLLKIAARAGHRVHVRAEGADADSALQALSDLIANRFGEPPAT
ncbi:MAG: PTS-dependent dihydroxyacetone kinase phosphotransferase subunit DhaM [Oscillochloris sp.]|nr:PTS-dependent dihydroxyacetone kinase phosphotransferase subunit DhaM [Oscillochloris sp.]